MINSKDLRAFTKQILNEDDDYEDLNDYDVNHLDYHYIEKCSDIRELKKLLKILKSGKEGYFLQMEDAIQKKLEELDPSLKKEPLPKKEDIANELNDWVNMLKEKDQKLKNNNNKAIFSKKDNHSVLTNELTFNTEEPFEKITKKTNKSNKNTDERIKSTDYRKWDLYDVEKEVKKIDVEDENNEDTQDTNDHDIERKRKVESYAKRLNKEKHIPEVSNEIKQKSLEELKVLAEIEKNKGNDCYKSKDYEEALIYYTRSLDLLEMPNVYTNRALVNLKMARFAEAEADATAALQINDPKFNFKAYLRRGESYSRRARYREAINDFSEALKLEPSNKEAENFLIKAQQKYLEVEGELAEKLDVKIKESSKPSKPKKKMLIKEVDEIKNDDFILNTEKSLDSDSKKVEDITDNKINKYGDKNKKIEELIANDTFRNKNNSKQNSDNKNSDNKNSDNKNSDNNKNDDKTLEMLNKKVLIEEINENSTNLKINKSEKNIIIEETNDKSNIEINDEKLEIYNPINKNEDENNISKNTNSLTSNYNQDKNILNNNINKSNPQNVDNNEITLKKNKFDKTKDEDNIVKKDIEKDISIMKALKKTTNHGDNSNKTVNNADINILSEEEEEEESIYSNYSEDEYKENKKSKMKFEPEKKSKMKSYIDSLKFYNEFDDEEENDMNSFNEEEIRKKLEKLNELKRYMNKKFSLMNNSENDNEEYSEDEYDMNNDDDILILDDENEEKKIKNRINDDNNIIVLDEEDEDEEEGIENEYNNDSGKEELNYLEFLKAKEKERYELYEKTMNNKSSNDSDININIDVDEDDDNDNDDLSDIYNDDDDDELLNIINSQLKQGTMNDTEKNYISKLLKNRRSQASLGSDNSDFEDYDYDSN